MISIKPRISVILPVFNLGDYLGFTMCNIVEDQFSVLNAVDWELIVVDDGSTDNSTDIIMKWVNKYPDSISLYRQDNAGPSAARNVGLAHAHGEYVYFCDGDDIIKRNALAQIVERILPYGADMVKVHLQHISDIEYRELQNNVPFAVIPQNVTLLSAAKYLEQSHGLVAGGRNNIGTYLTIYRRQFLIDNNLQFDCGFDIGEDELFTWSALLKANTVIDTNAEIYLYHNRESSLSHPTNNCAAGIFNLKIVKFTVAIQKIIEELNTRKTVKEELIDDIRDVYRHIYYKSLTALIVNPEISLISLRKAIKSYNCAGGKKFPGHIKLKPYYDPKLLPINVKLRRIIAAYILDR